MITGGTKMQHLRTTFAASIVVFTVVCSLQGGAGSTRAGAATTGSTSPQWVASWAASPSDDSFPIDPTLDLIPGVWVNQTIRDIITPHLGGSELRIHLSNRFSSSPTTFGHVTIGYQVGGANASETTNVTFGGSNSVTVAAGQDVVSDPVTFSFAAFEPLAVSIYMPGVPGSITKHWNANATSYYTITASGDKTNQWSGADYLSSAASWFYLDGLDVVASVPTRSIVAFGDSITDGFIGGSAISLPESATATNANGRYPDDLQRRLNAAGIPISVINAGIADNQLLTSGSLSGPSGLSRLSEDALSKPGVVGVLILEGINDLGQGGATPATMEAGFAQAISEVHAAGLKIWLGTILPASNSLPDGTSAAPNSEIYREEINAWILSQNLADGVVDFDAALRNPAVPSQLAPQYASVDNLHPNLAGYQEMANIIPLSLLSATNVPAE